MNEQKAPNGIEWTRVWNRRGWTWNPVGGCLHGCEWQMPDGTVAECYAKTVAERLAQKAYAQGFEHHYWHPERLNEPLKLKEPAGIFLDSMSDLMGHWVSDEQIEQVLDVCRQADWHIFFLLTKNPPRLKKFTFPPNVWVGVSAPPTVMNGKRLTLRQQHRWYDCAFNVLEQIDVPVRWTSIEPLSFGVSGILLTHPGAIQWAVIGAASNGRKEYPPDPIYFRNVLTALDKLHVPVFFKGNLRSLPLAAQNWREDFPQV